MDKAAQVSICCTSVVNVRYGVFTLLDTDTVTDKKWVIKNCVQVFILPDTDTDSDTDAIGLQTHFVGIGVCIGNGQCEHTVNVCKEIYFV